MLLWTSVIICTLYAILVQRGPESEEVDLDITLFSTQHSTFRHAWSFAVCLLIFACYNDAGGIVNQFLSLKCWQPFAKLTYTWYIIHYPLKTIAKVLSRYPEYFSPFLSTIFALGILLLTVILSVPWTLVFEMPFLHLQRRLQRSEGMVSDAGTLKDSDKATEKSSLKTLHQVTINSGSLSSTHTLADQLQQSA